MYYEERSQPMHLPTIFLSNKEELTLEELMEVLTQEHDDETVNLMVKHYCMESESLDIMKKSMEFLYLHGYYKELKELINKNKTSENASNRLWAKVYQINVDRRFGSDRKSTRLNSSHVAISYAV